MCVYVCSNGLKVLEEVVRLQREVWRHGTRVDQGPGVEGGDGASGDRAAGETGGRLMQRLCSVLLRRLADDELTMRCGLCFARSVGGGEDRDVEALTAIPYTALCIRRLCFTVGTRCCILY